MSPSPEPEHLNNHHRNTLRQLFEEPESHNIEWHAVLSLLGAVGSVDEHHDGTVTARVGAHAAYLDPPADKDIGSQMVADLRQLLTRAGYQG
jgi:hypothetical protein